MDSASPYGNPAEVARAVEKRRVDRAAERERYRTDRSRLAGEAQQLGEILVEGFREAGIDACRISPAPLASIGQTFGFNVLGIVFGSRSKRPYGIVLSIPRWTSGQQIGFFAFELEVTGVRHDGDDISWLDGAYAQPAARGSGNLDSVCEWIIDCAASIEMADH